MLSSVSYVCLGMCAGMWVISGGYLSGGRLGLAFPALGLFLFVFNFSLCVCSFYFYFEDVFSCTMCSDSQAAVPQGSGALLYLASSLLGCLQWLVEHSVLLPIISLLTTDGSLRPENMA